ncbi:molybdopterin molybdotransferase MoeA [Belliella aquatica]|uniref:Molybdopterin molybdenumtransferase n=1 Tax=Belliella aquatica TaxID=1323734 RepID=A0ABQ1M790_9BACT|nr:gephyrin-like molybdotransferase Glp [Belliella aquatica]MCH7405519.1 molybdopterin molybdotransferase MoeA [Belliella aquatica]GGC35619.1 molybdopterin molybdenumtransferase MoeA [Belliella aquatica]
MITVQEAKTILSEIPINRRTKTLPIAKSIGMFCAENIASPISVPSFDNSAMDGYSLAFEDLKSEMEISGEIKAGDSSMNKLKTGTAVRIFTGAPIPEGADTIVKQEIVTLQKGKFVVDPSQVKLGEFVRKAGTQCQIGQEVLRIGTELSSGTVALLASLGIQEVKVYDIPKVGVILTGDEVVSSDHELQPGQIYDANGPMLRTVLSQLGIDVEFVEKVKDEAEAVENSIKILLEKVDILILSGGISVGDYDFVRPALQNLGVRELFYKVAQKPGKPLYAGTLGTKTIFALPGNPSSSLSCFRIYVSPFIRKFFGADHAFETQFKFPLAESFQNDSSLTFFFKCVLKAGEIHLLSGQESFNLIAFNQATGLVEIPASNQKEQVFNYYPF